jgi:hypothetical protein
MSSGRHAARDVIYPGDDNVLTGDMFSQLLPVILVATTDRQSPFIDSSNFAINIESIVAVIFLNQLSNFESDEFYEMT